MDRRRSTHIIAQTLSAIMVIAISGCQTEATRSPVKITQPAAQERACMPSKYAHLIGRDKSALDALKLQKRTRILGPNALVTLDYLAERLNIHHNEAGKIIKFTCG